MATPASFADLINTRGAAPRVFVNTGADVWAVASSGEADAIYAPPAGGRVLAIDAAPSAQRVAVLVALRSGGRELLTLDAQGEVVGRWRDFVAGAATPVAAGVPGAGTDLVDWSPQGDRILVALPDGALFDVPASAESPTALSIDANGAQIAQPAWSPTGEALAFIAVDKDQRERALMQYDLRTHEVSTVIDPADGRIVVEFVWMPDGTSLLFTEGGNLGGATTGIDLWSVKADGEGRSLVASAGTVAPVARIGTMRPAPDGRSVAYAVYLPGDGYPQFDSVWIRDLATGVGYRTPLPSVVAVENLWWTDRGLVVSVVADGAGRERGPSLALLLLTPDGEVSAIWATPIGGATPAASTPLATPASA